MCVGVRSSDQMEFVDVSRAWRLQGRSSGAVFPTTLDDCDIPSSPTGTDHPNALTRTHTDNYSLRSTVKAKDRDVNLNTWTPPWHSTLVPLILTHPTDNPFPPTSLGSAAQTEKHTIISLDIVLTFSFFLIWPLLSFSLLFTCVIPKMFPPPSC